MTFSGRLRRTGDEARKNRNKIQHKTNNTTPRMPIFYWKEFLELNWEKGPERDIGSRRWSSFLSSLKYHTGDTTVSKTDKVSAVTEPVEDWMVVSSTIQMINTRCCGSPEERAVTQPQGPGKASLRQCPLVSWASWG